MAVKMGPKEAALRMQRAKQAEADKRHRPGKVTTVKVKQFDKVFTLKGKGRGEVR